MVEVFERAAGAMADSPLRQGSAVRIGAHATPQAAPGTNQDRSHATPRAAGASARLLVTGDLHDNPAHLQKILALAKLDESPGHHVVFHEIIHGERLVNGVDFSHRMLARIAELAVAHPTQVHPLLANHELAQLTGKGISKGAGNSVEMFNEGLEYVFGDDWLEVDAAIKRFIAAMPLALITDRGVLCAHSLPAEAMMDRFDAAVLDRPPTADDYAAPSGSAHLMVWGRNHSIEHIERLASAWGVKLLCIGHEHVETGAEARGSRLLILNSDHERGRVVGIDLMTDPPSAEDALLRAVPLAAV